MAHTALSRAAAHGKPCALLLMRPGALAQPVVHYGFIPTIVLLGAPYACLYFFCSILVASRACINMRSPAWLSRVRTDCRDDADVPGADACSAVESSLSQQQNRRADSRLRATSCGGYWLAAILSGRRLAVMRGERRFPPAGTSRGSKLKKRSHSAGIIH